MMDKRPRKELIDGLRDSLRDFEERYDRSEWENFQQQRKNKRRKPIPLVVKLAGIAASLFLMVYAAVRVLPMLDRPDDTGKDIPKEVPRSLKETEQGPIDTLTVDSVTQGIAPNTQETTGFLDPMPAEEAAIHEETGSRKRVAPVENAGSMADSIALEPPLKAVPLQTVHLAKKFGGNSKRPHRKPDRPMRLNFLRLGLNVTPAFTNKGFSLGGGVSARIPLSGRLSTEVGVSYMNLRVGTDREADKTDTVTLQVVGIRNSVGAVAIPVSLNYAISGNFSASLGLMPFRVVRDQRTDILQSYRWVNGNLSSGDTTGRIVGERTRMKRADSLYMGNTYLGFIRVSGQYSPPLFKKRNVVIAPYVALPLGRLRNDEYRWIHGGVSVRWYLR